ncbi:hypothetical protein Q0F98_22945 [Paenibacillus amylolyticus]|nr:hypothetical protein Q0F98_22945 [Paenibacillus amylolyticus]
MKNWKREMWSGIQYVYHDRFLRGLAILSVTITLMYSIILSTQIFLYEMCFSWMLLHSVFSSPLQPSAAL